MRVPAGSWKPHLGTYPQTQIPNQIAATLRIIAARAPSLMKFLGSTRWALSAILIIPETVNAEGPTLTHMPGREPTTKLFLNLPVRPAPHRRVQMHVIPSMDTKARLHTVFQVAVSSSYGNGPASGKIRGQQSSAPLSPLQYL